MAAQEERLCDSRDRSFMHHGGARWWPGGSICKDLKQIVANPQCSLPVGEAGGRCLSGKARACHSTSKAMCTKVQDRKGRYDHSSALSVVLPLVNKLENSRDMSEEVAETVNAVLKIMWRNVASKQL